MITSKNASHISNSYEAQTYNYEIFIAELFQLSLKNEIVETLNSREIVKTNNVRRNGSPWRLCSLKEMGYTETGGKSTGFGVKEPEIKWSSAGVYNPLKLVFCQYSFSSNPAVFKRFDHYQNFKSSYSYPPPPHTHTRSLLVSHSGLFYSAIHFFPFQSILRCRPLNQFQTH